MPVTTRNPAAETTSALVVDLVVEEETLLGEEERSVIGIIYY
jgi:hypothetical protein